MVNYRNVEIIKRKVEILELRDSKNDLFGFTEEEIAQYNKVMRQFNMSQKLLKNSLKFYDRQCNIRSYKEEKSLLDWLFNTFMITMFITGIFCWILVILSKLGWLII